MNTIITKIRIIKAAIIYILLFVVNNRFEKKFAITKYIIHR